MSWLSEFLRRLFRSTPPAPPVQPAPPPSASIYVLFNRERGALPPLTRDTRLDGVAQDHANWMANGGGLHHDEGRVTPADRLTAVGIQFTEEAENIDREAVSAAAVVDVWMNSPPHRANIFGPFHRVGVGRTGNWWCAIFVR